MLTVYTQCIKQKGEKCYIKEKKSHKIKKKRHESK